MGHAIAEAVFISGPNMVQYNNVQGTCYGGDCGYGLRGGAKGHREETLTYWFLKMKKMRA